MFSLTDPSSGTGQLRVKFKTKPTQKPTALSRVYEYNSIPEGVFLEMLSSPTPAAFLHKNIKDRYGYRRLTTEELEAETNITAPKVNPSPRRDFDDSTFDSILEDDDELFASASGLEKTAQSDNTGPVERLKLALQREEVFKYLDLTFSIRPDRTGWIAVCDRTSLGYDLPTHQSQRAYTGMARAINSLVHVLEGHLRVNQLNFDPHSGYDPNIGDGVVRDGGYTYRVGTERDEYVFYVIKRHKGSRMQILPGIAFSSKSDADNYLKSTNMLNAFGFVEPIPDAKIEPPQPDPRTSAPKMIDWTEGFDIDLFNDDDEFTV